MWLHNPVDRRLYVSRRLLNATTLWVLTHVLLGHQDFMVVSCIIFNEIWNDTASILHASILLSVELFLKFVTSWTILMKRVRNNLHHAFCLLTLQSLRPEKCNVMYFELCIEQFCKNYRTFPRMELPYSFTDCIYTCYTICAVNVPIGKKRWKSVFVRIIMAQITSSGHWTKFDTMQFAEEKIHWSWVWINQW